MKTFRCVKNCFLDGKLYKRNDEVVASEAPAKFFKEKSLVKKAEAVEEEPKTYKELQEKEAKAMLPKKKAVIKPASDTPKKTVKRAVKKK